jgi:hypothetical protein
MTTYTVYNPSGGMEAESGMSLADAANKMLTYDGHEWEIREEGGAFNLYTSQFSRCSPCGGGDLTPSVIYSYASNRDAAETEIFERVTVEDWWHLECATDAEYARWRADATEESEDC